VTAVPNALGSKPSQADRSRLEARVPELDPLRTGVRQEHFLAIYCAVSCDVQRG